MKSLIYDCETHYSIQRGFSHIPDLVHKAYELKIDALAITDFHTVSGAVEFLNEIKKINKTSDHKIKPIIGTKICVIDSDGNLIEDILLAKNLNGYFELIKLLSNTKIDDKQNYFIDSLLVNEALKNQNILAISQYPSLGSDLVSVQYVLPEDVLYQQIVICSKLQLSLQDKELIIDKYPEYKELFDGTICNHLRLPNTSIAYDTLFNLIEEYTLDHKAYIPQFNYDKTKYSSPHEMLTALCREGWVKTGTAQRVKSDSSLKEIYTARIKEELGVFEKFGLSDYMLIIWDIVNFARQQGQYCNPRGSAVGCLVSYLIGISDIDPMRPDPTLEYSPDRVLLFERFFNKSRVNSLPDIDCDFSPEFRDAIFDYIKSKYGADCVSQIITFAKLDGRGIIKEVFRILNPGKHSFNIANDITNQMINTNKVQDILEDLKEDDPEYNIINYNIEHNPRIAEYYKEYPREFDIAIKMANTIKSYGRHAAGIIIGNKPIKEYLPQMTDFKNNIPLVAFQFTHAEQVGGCKYDILGVHALSKVKCIEDMVNNNKTQPDIGVLYGK